MGANFFKLPGGRLRPGEDGAHRSGPAGWPLLLCTAPLLPRLPIVPLRPRQADRAWALAGLRLTRSPHPAAAEAEGLLRKLNGLLAPPTESMRPDWRIADVLGTWYRWVLHASCKLHHAMHACVSAFTAGVLDAW